MLLGWHCGSGGKPEQALLHQSPWEKDHPERTGASLCTHCKFDIRMDSLLSMTSPLLQRNELVRPGWTYNMIQDLVGRGLQ